MSSKPQSGANPDLLGGDEAATEADEGAQSVADETEQSHRELSLDHVFEILKNERRRTVLRYLDEHDGTVSLGELAEHVAAVENDTTVAQVTSNERKCVYVGLYQCHLPKMDDMDIVDFNQNRGRISLGPNADRLNEYLDRSERTERPWPAYYGSVAGGGALLLVLSQFGGAVGLTPTVAAVLTVLGIAGCSLAQARDRRDED